MRLRTFAFFCAAAIASADLSAAEPLTFDQAITLAAGRAGDATAAAPLRAEIAALRRSQLPSVRAEVTGNTSRTLDLFAEGPLAVRYASSVLAFDYPLWGGSSTRARMDALRSKLQRVETGAGLDDARYTQIVDAFADLYVIQRQTEVTRTFAERIEEAVKRSEELLSKGEISNLIATERQESALAYRTRLLDLEARRIEAASRLRLLTGLESEPSVSLDPAAVREIAADAASFRDDVLDNANIAVEESRSRLEIARSGGGFRAFLSGFAGVGAAESDFRSQRSSGSFGIYGLRLNLVYPLIGGSSGVAIAQAQADLARSIAVRDEAMRAASVRAAEWKLRQETAARRAVLMEQSIDAARRRVDSLQRLVEGGVRSESDLAIARDDLLQREIDLLQTQIARWKAAQVLARMTSNP